MADWGQGFQGAAGGAMAGGAFGGPIGAAIGGGVGLLGGLFGGGDERNEYQEMLKKLAGGYGSRTAPQGSASLAGRSGLEANRNALIAQLEAQARGEGPSAARIQMQEAMDRAAGAQASAASGAGGRGVNAGAALRNAQNNTAAIQAQGSRDMATMRAQEQLAATQALGGVLGQGINADNSLSSFNAGQQNQMTQANMQAVLQQLGLNDASQLQALMAAMGGSAPGMGTQILAGGAQAMPWLMQMGKPKQPTTWANGQGSMYGLGTGSGA